MRHKIFLFSVFHVIIGEMVIAGILLGNGMIGFSFLSALITAGILGLLGTQYK